MGLLVDSMTLSWSKINLKGTRCSRSLSCTVLQLRVRPGQEHNIFKEHHLRSKRMVSISGRISHLAAIWSLFGGTLGPPRSTKIDGIM
ncbi:hypothetical protein BDN71DRAFT_1151463 [Pleurotus eryngii]|uniref:Uncharacterized protein n=1 Tax=Pleurotus eryngii TaxID=5323 RepID=A0A9P5ZRX7_PLEER|nr:hypothetical protein BDN71DRAFT_1151463 [Pleurotus eryngii]